jgi:hypothetical protein
MDLCCSFLSIRKEPKEIWLKIFCYKFSSISLLGKQLAMLKQFPSLPFHYTEFISRKIFNAGKYEPNKGRPGKDQTRTNKEGAEYGQGKWVSFC